MNKLHVIYGLVAIKQYDELAIYLQDLLKPEQEFANRLALLVKNPLVAGFMIGEREKFAERKTTLDFEISPELPPNPNTQETKTLLSTFRATAARFAGHHFDPVRVRTESSHDRLSFRRTSQTNGLYLAYSSRLLPTTADGVERLSHR